MHLRIYIVWYQIDTILNRPDIEVAKHFPESGSSAAHRALTDLLNDT